MVGELGLISEHVVIGSASDGVLNLTPQYGSVGKFLVQLNLVVDPDNAITYAINVTKQPGGTDVFRTRHVQRKFWSTVAPMWSYDSSYDSGADELTLFWKYTAPTAGVGHYTLYRYYSPFSKPLSNADTYVHTAYLATYNPSPLYPPKDDYLPLTPSNLDADQYSADGSGNPILKADPIFFFVDLADGEYIKIETKCYVEKPYRDGTLLLDDTYPTGFAASDSEIETAYPGLGTVTAWMLRI